MIIIIMIFIYTLSIHNYNSSSQQSITINCQSVHNASRKSLNSEQECIITG